MKTEDLIATLVNEAVPVKRIARPITSVIRWFLASTLCVFVGLAIFGLRHDYANAITSSWFLLQLVVIAAMVILSVISAFLLSIPDKKNWLAEVLPIFTFALWFGILVFGVLVSDDYNPGRGLGCLAEVVVLGLLPAAFLFLC